LDKVAERYGELFDPLYDEVERLWGRGAEATLRGERAVLQILQPFAATYDTGGVERSIEEVESSGEISAYLKASIKAQIILLNREPARNRVAKYPNVPR